MNAGTLAAVAAVGGAVVGVALDRGVRALLDPAPFLDDGPDDYVIVRDRLVDRPRQRPSGAVTTRHLAVVDDEGYAHLEADDALRSTLTTTDPQETQP